MDRSEKAVHYFRNGYNCAQSVAVAFQDTTKMNEEEILRISSGFGAGMGRQQLTCGAVSGGYMVLGAVYGGEDTPEAKEKVYSVIRKCAEEFKSLHKTTECLDLLGCNLQTEEGQNRFKEQDLKVKICEKCIIDIVHIVEKLI